MKGFGQDNNFYLFIHMISILTSMHSLPLIDDSHILLWLQPPDTTYILNIESESKIIVTNWLISLADSYKDGSLNVSALFIISHL